MTDHPGSEADHGAAQAEAADWVVRLSQSGIGEADWLSFEAWLHASAANRVAFDAAQALWLEYDLLAGDVAADLATPTPALRRRAATTAVRRPAPRRWIFAMAACLVVAVVGLVAMREIVPPATLYRTAAAERLKATLPDGSVIHLNSNSSASVRYNRFGRKVELTGAEAAFDVVPDPARPFVVAVRDSTVRVVGTEFNIRTDGEDLAVTVRRGAVQVAPRAGVAGNTLKVSAGRQLIHRHGLDRVVDITVVDDAFSWRSGQLVYRSRPLAEVVRDLNRYFSGGIVIRGEQAAGLHFSGVLNLDDERSVVARLCELLPLAASEQNGSIILQGRQTTR